TGEQQVPRCAQHSHVSAALPDLVGPADLAGLIVDRLDKFTRPQLVVAAAPAFGLRICVGQKENAVSLLRMKIKQTRLGIERRSLPVGSTMSAGAEKAPIGRRIFLR